MAAVWAFALCFLIVADVVGRGVFGRPVQGTPEIVANSIVMIVFLQSGYAIRSHSMLRADFLLERLGSMPRKVMLGLGYLLGCLFFLTILLGSIEPTLHSWVSGEYEGEGALRVPAWPTRVVILIGSALAILNYVVLAVLDIFTLKSDTRQMPLVDE